MLLLDVPNQRFQMQNLSSAAAAAAANPVNVSPAKSEPPGGAARLDVRAMPLPKNSSSSADDSFNTERLEDQNSAENLRQSMQKYLHSKQSHLMKVSEQLALKSGHSSIRNSPSGISEGSSVFTSSNKVAANSAAQRVLFPELAGTIGPTAKYNAARSLEDLRDSGDAQARFSLPPSQHSAGGGGGELLSLQTQSSLARYLYNSESNLSQLSAAEALSIAATKPASELSDGGLPSGVGVGASGGSQPPPPTAGKPGNMILRPCDQYPSEPGVLKHQPSSSSSLGGGSVGFLGHPVAASVPSGGPHPLLASQVRPISAQSGSLVSLQEEDEEDEDVWRNSKVGLIYRYFSFL